MSRNHAPPLALLAMFVAAAMLLLLQIGVTRVLSSTLMYHFAFFVIAAVMLGLAASAARVFVHVAREGEVNLVRCAKYLEITSVILFVAGVSYPHLGALGWDGAALGGQLAAVMVLFTPVFYFVGYTIAALLTKYNEDIGRIYWFDLLGAAAGCLLVVPLLGLVPALGVVVQCGALALVAALALHKVTGASTKRQVAVLIGAIVLATITSLVPGLTEIRYAKGQPQDDVVWEKWNHLARVTVSEDMPGTRQSMQRLKDEGGSDAQARAVVDRWSAGWGLSNAFEGAGPEIRWIALDSGAGTQIIKDGGKDPSQLDFLAWDITSAGHHMKPGGLEEVFVIGGGGGRDILTALHLGARNIDVVELNPLVFESVEEAFGDFSGRPYSHQNVNTTVGEARGVLSRTDKRYDLIQMSMIDTWAATMAGSLALVENVLYTKEAFDLFVSRLDDDGMLTVSRWFNPDYPGELMRTLLLMGEALRGIGVGNDAAPKHIAVLHTRGHLGTGVATCLLQRTPFSPGQLSELRHIAEKHDYDLIWPSERADIPRAIRAEPGAFGGPEFDDSIPTDDRPFFFNLHKPLMSWVVAAREGDAGKGSRPTAMVFIVLIGVALAAYWLVLRPLLEHNREQPEDERLTLRDNKWATLYFAGLGLGFMGVELGLIQRTIVFLGHPTYSLSVVLFSLLLFTGIGSGLSTRRDGSVAPIIGGLLVGLAFLIFGAPALFASLHDASIEIRIATSVACIAPLGVLMGMLLPTGMSRLVKVNKQALVPWMWAINGVFGVVATVVSMFIATSFGYTALIVTAAAAYLLTLVAASRPAHW